MCVCISVCINVCVCVYLCVYTCMQLQFPQRPEESVECPKTGVPGSCELPHLGAENQIQVLCKSIMFS